MRRTVLLLAAAALAVTPAAAQRLRYLNPQDVAEAQREHAELVRELGGAETGARAAYVQSIGRRVGAFSGVANPGQALHFTMLNSAVENALSVPGGYVYVTRQLMGLMDDESQLLSRWGTKSDTSRPTMPTSASNMCNAIRSAFSGRSSVRSLA